jgi:hypothetical protein
MSRSAAPAPGSSGYHVVKTVSIPGDESWDYLTVDAAARRVYISHGSHVVVMNADTYTVEGDIPDTQGVHGIALAPDLGRGFVSAGRANTAVIFDIKSLKTLGTVKTDANPDAIVYDSVTKRVFTLNGRGQNTTAINGADGTVAGTLALGGKPEFADADGKGRTRPIRRPENHGNPPLAASSLQIALRPGHGPQESPPLRRLRRKSHGRRER